MSAEIVVTSKVFSAASDPVMDVAVWFGFAFATVLLIYFVVEAIKSVLNGIFQYKINKINLHNAEWSIK